MIETVQKSIFILYYLKMKSASKNDFSKPYPKRMEWEGRYLGEGRVMISELGISTEDLCNLIRFRLSVCRRLSITDQTKKEEREREAVVYCLNRLLFYVKICHSGIIFYCCFFKKGKNSNGSPFQMGSFQANLMKFIIFNFFAVYYMAFLISWESFMCSTIFISICDLSKFHLFDYRRALSQFLLDFFVNKIALVLKLVE